MPIIMSPNVTNNKSWSDSTGNEGENIQFHGKIVKWDARQTSVLLKKGNKQNKFVPRNINTGTIRMTG